MARNHVARDAVLNFVLTIPSGNKDFLDNKFKLFILAMKIIFRDRMTPDNTFIVLTKYNDEGKDYCISEESKASQDNKKFIFNKLAENNLDLVSSPENM